MPTEPAAASRFWELRTRRLALDRTLIMGVLNVTPDSFSDGGLRFDPARAVEHGLAMSRAGADIVDVGGESTRPGAKAVDVDEEMDRVAATVEGLAEEGVVVSIDTTKPAVGRMAIGLGAEIINDVSGFRDPLMAQVAADTGVGLVVMHMLGDPRTMQDDPRYEDVVQDVLGYLVARAASLESQGVRRDRIALDPGIGFGKTLVHNLELLRGVARFAESGYPIVLGPSRKRFLGSLTGIEEPADRDVATAAAATLGIAGGAAILRVHNVPLVRQAAQVADAIVRTTWRSPD